MPSLTHDLLATVRARLEATAPPVALCATCGAFAGEAHACDVSRATAWVAHTAWRYVLDGSTPWRRAISYRVR